MTPASLPYEHASLPASVNVAGRDGLVIEGFGDVRVRAMEGLGVAIEITEEITGTTIVAVLDGYRPKRARVNLQVDELTQPVQAASKVDGMPDPFPEPR